MANSDVEMRTFFGLPEKLWATTVVRWFQPWRPVTSFLVDEVQRPASGSEIRYETERKRLLTAARRWGRFTNRSDLVEERCNGLMNEFLFEKKEHDFK